MSVTPGLPNETDMKKENGVSVENTEYPLDEIEWKSPERGLNTRGIMQNMRRGTDSHKIEKRDE